MFISSNLGLNLQNQVVALTKIKGKKNPVFSEKFR
jgi:hypothetical protein